MTLSPDSWPRRYCAEYFNVSEYLVRTARDFKKVKEILARPTQKQVKVMSKNTIDLALSMYENDEVSRQTPGKKVYVSVVKGVNKQKRKPKRNACCFQGKIC